MKLRTSLVAALSAALLCLPVAVPATTVPATAAPATAALATAAPATARVVPAAPAPVAASGRVGGAASGLGAPVYRKLQTTTKRVPVTVQVTRPRHQKVSLQRKDSGRWRTVSSTRAPRTGVRATVKLKVPAKAGHRAYRVVLAASPSSKKRVSSSFKIFQSDAKKHAKYVAKARKYIKRYCPSTPIYIDSPSVKGTWAIGMAWTTWQWRGRWSGRAWAYDWTWSQTIELASGLSDAQLRHTALHECAHIVQARPIGRSQAAYDASVATEEKIFAGGGEESHEQQADCMASAITGSTRYNYYTSSCGGARGKNAKAMWKKWGKKYLDPERSWTTRTV